MQELSRLLMARPARLVAAVAVFASGAWIAQGVRAQVAHGDAAFGFEGTASAAGVQVLAKFASDPTATQFEGSSPTVSALVSSEPDSQAFAADPYPGKDLLSLAASLPTGPPPSPEVASSGNPGRPKQEMSAPGYSISAESTATTSHAHGENGASSAGTAAVGDVAADAQVAATATQVTSTATSAAQGFVAGPLSISGVDTKAVATLDAGGKMTLSSSIAVSDISVNGSRVAVSSNGLDVAGTTVPLPDASPLTTALEQAGITVTYVKETKTPTGVTAPALSIHVVDPTGQSDTTYLLGQASAGVQPQLSFGSTGGEASDLGTGVGTGVGGGGGGGGGVPSAGSGGSAPSLPTGSGSATAAPSGGAPSVASPQTPQRLGPVARSVDTVGGGLFYLVLVIAAAAALGTGQLMRLLGVRWARSSG